MKTRQRFFPSSLFNHSSSSFINFSYAFSESSGKVFIVCSKISSSILMVEESVINHCANGNHTLSSEDFEEGLSLSDSNTSDTRVQRWKDSYITTHLSLFDCFHSKPCAKDYQLADKTDTQGKHALLLNLFHTAQNKFFLVPREVPRATGVPPRDFALYVGRISQT